MSKEGKAWFQVLQELMEECPGIVVAAFFEGAIKGSRPFIAIYLTSLLIDAAYEGASINLLIFYALMGASAGMVISFLGGIVEKKFNQNMEYMYERQTGPLSRKSMQMDFEYLEDAKVHNLREGVTGFVPRFGLLGCVLDCLYHAMDVFFTMICAVIIILPRLISGRSNGDGFIGSVWCSCLFMITLLIITFLHMNILTTYNKKMEELYQERTPLRTRKKFYLDLYAKAESQKDIRMCKQEKLIQSEFGSIHEKAFDIRRRSVKTVVTRDLQTESLAALSTVLVFVFSALYGYYGIISLGSVVGFVASIRRVADSMFTLGEVVNDFRYEGTCARKYVEFMNLNQRKHEGTIPVEKRRDNKFEVAFEHVSFKYPGAKDYVIKDLSLKFIIGEKLAIVGKNGSGKTTFIKLLCRLYDVTEGCIKVNGIDIRKYDYKEYCDLFSVVFQDFSIFDFPLGESIASSVNVDGNRALDALYRAGLGDRLDKLSEGLGTYIGKGFDETGVSFSGGEKQKLAIARAIYKDAPFVIMDEPTAALDPEAESEVFEGFDKMVGKKTAIYISHRLASCKFCEDILVFDKGKMVQHGTHEELEKQDGLYRQLWNAQAKYYAENL